MKNRYYADAYGADLNALKACVKKAFEIADADDEVARVVFYSYTKNNFVQVSRVFGDDYVDLMFTRPLRCSECSKPIRCMTAITYKKECEFRDSPKDVVVCCHMDSKDVFKVDDYRTAKYIIALSWNLNGLDAWKKRWNAQNVLEEETVEESMTRHNSVLMTALREMDVRMFQTKNLGHPDDAETCKTYIRAIHKYIPDVMPAELENCLVTEFGWENRNASEVGGLLQRLKEGRTFRGGQKTYLKEYYTRWKAKS